MTFSLGIDFGTNSVRALIVSCADGTEIGSCVAPYESGREGILLDEKDHHLARQSPLDYLRGLEACVRGAVAEAAKNHAFSPSKLIAIGVDSTGSSPIPVDERNRPLALDPRFKDELAAQCWLWKDHTSHREAREITALAAEKRPHFIAKCGDTYSSEWWWSKILHCLRVAPEVFDAAYSWVELCDFIPSVLAGVSDPRKVQRGICAAGHKALYSEEWGGLPDREFLGWLDPKLASLRDRLYDRAFDASVAAGELCPEWAAKLGLPAGIPIAIGAFDVHFGAIGSGVREGVLVKVIGTSTCDCTVVATAGALGGKVADIPGICGIVPGSILPGFSGVEAGQSAVGDIFKWFVETVCRGDASLYGELEREARALEPGQSGLLALDWNNGNRTILVDPLLTGLLMGQTLHTTRAEIYRSLIEATAYGARAIVERISDYGVKVEHIVCAGGVAEKSPLLMQIYADVLGCEVSVAGSSQACALGSAVVGAVLAGEARGGHATFVEAQRKMTSLKPQKYVPIEENRRVYNQLYGLYRRLHDSFGGVSKSADLASVMKDLIRLKEGQIHEETRNMVRHR